MAHSSVFTFILSGAPSFVFASLLGPPEAAILIALDRSYDFGRWLTDFGDLDDASTLSDPRGGGRVLAVLSIGPGVLCSPEGKRKMITLDIHLSLYLHFPLSRVIPFTKTHDEHKGRVTFTVFRASSARDSRVTGRTPVKRWSFVDSGDLPPGLASVPPRPSNRDTHGSSTTPLTYETEAESVPRPRAWPGSDLPTQVPPIQHGHGERFTHASASQNSGILVSVE